MKRFLLYIVLLAAGFISSCKKDENPIFDAPDTRLAATLSEHQTELVAAENGWKATIYPKLGKGFSFYIKFDADGKVKMLSDFNASTAVTFQESTYRLKALQFPTLMFDTYNYIHLPSDPNGSVSGGINGKGLTSDFEFAFIEKVGDTLKMSGIVNANPMFMVKATAAEATAFNAGGIKTMMDANTAFLSVNKFPYLVSGADMKVSVTMDVASKKLTLSYIDEKGASKVSSAAFAFALNGISLSVPLTYGTTTIKDLFWDTDAKQYYVNVGGKRSNVLNATVPVLPLAPLFGPLKDYSQIEYNVANVTAGLSSDFNAKLVAGRAAIGLVSPGGRVLDKATLKLNIDNTMSLTYSYRNSAGSTLLSVMTYSFTKDANGEYTFTYLTTDGNGATVGPALMPITNYFSNNKFKLDWVANPASGGAYGGLYSTTDNASFFYGNLIK
jgi:hypothetical protein